ncbi:hypothetical protein B7993_10685 [Fibrobacter sp. UWH3]|nr:hypothetical protein B7993_10685 [Fibrobacter sp. UWH3]
MSAGKLTAAVWARGSPLVKPTSKEETFSLQAKSTPASVTARNLMMNLENPMPKNEAKDNLICREMQEESQVFSNVAKRHSELVSES